MKLAYAALLSMSTILIAALYSGMIISAGLRINSVLLPRKEWILTNNGQWVLGWWLWLFAIFCWMVLLATLMWRYSPVHRVATMLQSGLMIVSAVLAIIGVLTWMNLLPVVMMQPDDSGQLIPTYVALVDTFATSLLAAGCLMGGGVTAWIGLDLLRLQKLPSTWLAPAIIAGLLIVPAPFFLPNPYPLIVAATVWVGWCLFVATRRAEPPAFPEIL